MLQMSDLIFNFAEKNLISRNMIDVKATLKESEERMEMAALFLEDSLNRIRAGRANVASCQEYA